jgi:hypothetical protein
MKEEGCGRPWWTCRGVTEAVVAGPRAEETTAFLLKLMLTWFETHETLPTVEEQSVDMIWKPYLWSLGIVVQEMAMADKRRPLLQTLLISSLCSSSGSCRSGIFVDLLFSSVAFIPWRWNHPSALSLSLSSEHIPCKVIFDPALRRWFVIQKKLK